MKNVKRARQALADSQQTWNSTMHSKKHEKEIVTLYTLAPETLDKPGTVSVGSYWLYSDDNVPEQALREVLVDKESSVAQMQAYRLKIPYITFSEEGLNKALSKGLVYRADSQEDKAIVLYNGMPAREENAIVAGIDATIAHIENALQETEEKVIMAKKKAPKAPVTKEEPKAHVSALDAILAAPIEKSASFYKGILSAVEEDEQQEEDELHAPVQMCEICDKREGTTAMYRNNDTEIVYACEPCAPRTPRKHLALPEERTEDALVAGIAPAFAIHAEMYKAFVQAFKQALKEEGLVIMPAHALVPMPGCGEASPKVPVPVDTITDAWGSLMDMPQAPAPAPCDTLGDAWGSLMETPKVPARPKSTLVLGPKVGKAPKAPVRDIPGNHGKVPVDTIIAIQTAWKNKTATQAELAAKYGMDDKKVWYFCNRAKQLV